jgi:hypothetical protein
MKEKWFCILLFSVPCLPQMYASFRFEKLSIDGTESGMEAEETSCRDVENIWFGKWN